MLLFTISINTRRINKFKCRGVGHRPLNLTLAPINVTFDRLHSILYRNSSSKLIYRFRRKYFNKTFNSSYLHIFLTKNIFTSIVRKLGPNIKLQFDVEIGSCTGNSAIIMGNVLKSEYPGSLILCIDTWLGGAHLLIKY
ncbi:unnamed protein product [Rotaria magnacalcarata]|uniref:Uncharacterized protein n=1 Tax=Rotaria magnacalcarata TaxID=392030 RepID=A0A815NL58_9BILA|nr:unnamed protein product [Rotaria magnacalcarata]CAF1625151.1 unnamed protein product [Rotaria magnacalcarata]CAF2092403.1 unnamed protein product [Rotaria magnacalcarata]CAF2109432.1 unnamed protein product [Rotaria magnacalcarata]CAF2132675.1 unnamed protein product [Rotaria magnacalcarata]